MTPTEQEIHFKHLQLRLLTHSRHYESGLVFKIQKEIHQLEKQLTQ